MCFRENPCKQVISISPLYNYNFFLDNYNCIKGKRYTKILGAYPKMYIVLSLRSI
jgi:hypothetical protein